MDVVVIWAQGNVLLQINKGPIPITLYLLASGSQQEVVRFLVVERNCNASLTDGLLVVLAACQNQGPQVERFRIIVFCSFDTVIDLVDCTVPLAHEC